MPDQQRSSLCVFFVFPSCAVCDCAHFSPVFWFHLRWPRNAERERRSHEAPTIRCIRRLFSELWAHHRRWHLWTVSTWRYHDRQFEQQPLGIARSLRSRAQAHQRLCSRIRPPDSAQRQTQPMELTPTPTKDKGTSVKKTTRHSQENTQPAPPQLAELYDQQWDRPNQEEELTTESLAQYQQIGDGQPTVTRTDNLPQVLVTEASAQYQQTEECRMAHFAETAQLTHPISSPDEAVTQPNPASSRPTRTTSPHHDDKSEVDSANGRSVHKPTASAHVLPVPRATVSSHQANHDCNCGATETQHGNTYTPSE